VNDVTDHFERLGLPRRFAIDTDRIEREYLARTREVHPDFYSGADASEQSRSLDLSSRLNESYAVLKDPRRRAEHLMILEGGPTAADQKQMQPEFLEEMLELRMAIEELRETEPVGSEAFTAMEQQLLSRQQSLFETVGASFERLLPMPKSEPNRTTELKSIRESLNAAKYIQGLIRDLGAD